MSRLPTGIAIPSSSLPKQKRLTRQPSLDLRKRKTVSDIAPPPVPKTSKSTKSRSRSLVSDDTRAIPPTPKPSRKLREQPPQRQQSNGFGSDLCIGDRIAVDSMGIVGTLRFLGDADFKEGLWAGIQLDIIGSGKNDGSVKG